MRLTKGQLKRIIREEKRKLQEMSDIYPRPQHPMIANAGANMDRDRIACIAEVLRNDADYDAEDSEILAGYILSALKEEGLC